MSALAGEELERYARHIVLGEVGGPGQRKLKAARVLVIGAGGLGAPALLYLAAAGVGTLAIVDDDHVALSNLQRQVIHTTADVGRPKTRSARDAILRLNHHVVVETHELRAAPDTLPALLDGATIALDGSDNFATRYAAADACAAAGVPLITAAVGRFDASITTLKPYAAGPDGRPYPGYRDLFPAPPAPGVVPACAEAGVLGALTGLVGTMMALEALKEIAGFGDGLAGRLLLIDTLGMRFEEIGF